MRIVGLAAIMLANGFAFASAAPAAEPEGSWTCTAAGEGGFDCQGGKCNPSRVTSGSIRLDFAAKVMCALRGSECIDAKKLQLATVEEGSNTIVAAASEQGATMVYRIGSNGRMVMAFLLGTGRVILFTGECKKS